MAFTMIPLNIHVIDVNRYVKLVLIMIVVILVKIDNLTLFLDVLKNIIKVIIKINYKK